MAYDLVRRDGSLPSPGAPPEGVGHDVRVTSSTSRRLGPLLLATCLALLGLVAVAGPASAHAQLVSITPADGAVLTTAPTSVVLVFDDTVAPNLAVVTVKNASGANLADGKAATDGAKVTQALAADLPAGSYTISWKVVSDDGHPVSKTSTFTLKEAGVATPLTSGTTDGSGGATSSATQPSPVANGSATDAAAASSGGRSSTGALWLGALALVVIGILGFARALRRRPGGPGHHGGDA